LNNEKNKVGRSRQQSKGGKILTAQGNRPFGLRGGKRGSARTSRGLARTRKQKTKRGNLELAKVAVREKLNRGDIKPEWERPGGYLRKKEGAGLGEEKGRVSEEKKNGKEGVKQFLAMPISEESGVGLTVRCPPWVKEKFLEERNLNKKEKEVG